MIAGGSVASRESGSGWSPSLFFVALGLAALHVLTLQPGHEWGDDFALYILHARNLAEGLPYAATGYIYNPENAVVGPRAYPWGFPLALAPLYARFGLDYMVFKAENVAFLLLFLLFASLTLARELPPGQSGLLMAALGVSPGLIAVKNHVVSDVLYACLCWLALLLYRRQESGTGGSTVRSGLALGAVLYAGVATRSVGVVLFPVVVAGDLLRHRRVRPVVRVACLVGLGLTAGEKLLLAADLSYLDQLRTDVTYVASNARDYALAFQLVWLTGVPLVDRGLLAVLHLAAGVGFYRRVRGRATVLDAFFVIYGLAVVLWPAVQPRLLLPLLPVYALYCTEALRPLFRGTLRERLAMAGAVLVVSGVGAARAMARPGMGVEEPSAQQMFTYLRDQTPPDSVVIFRKPRVVCLYAGRPSAAYHTGDAAPLGTFFRSIDADYLVVPKVMPADVFGRRDEEFVEYLWRYVEREGPTMPVVFENEGYRVLAIPAEESRD